jgi:PKD repeat protein
MAVLGLSGLEPLTAAAPRAGFTFTPSAPVAGQAVAFKDTSTGSPTTWSWTFGDGGTSTVQHPDHAYGKAGKFTVTLKASNASGSSKVSRTLTVTVAPPVAGFSFAPSAPAAGQALSFTDTSSGNPTSWAWTFGDGATSTLRNPSHTYSAAGGYTATLNVRNAGGSSTTSRTVAVSPAEPPAAPLYSVVLGRPTDTSIAVSALVDPGTAVSLDYGLASGSYTGHHAAVTSAAGEPVVFDVTGLAPNALYYYRLNVLAPGGALPVSAGESTFRTARPAGSTFSFTVQSDSHLDQNSILDVYHRTLANVLADSPDFHLDLGDTFMCEKYSAPLTSTVRQAPDQATVDARYVYERANFGLAAHSVPLLLVNGNHEGELGWLLDKTGENLPVWATRARHEYFLNPAPDGFYAGDSYDEPVVGQRRSWYAWHWGEALFVVLDPYWNTTTKAGTDGWAYTLGQRQYTWLQQTLASSPAAFKFVFIHNLVGGLDGQMRGGVEAAPYFEWGGKNLDGTDGFPQKRPGWSLPIHQLLAYYKVTAVFHGHDHLYAQQELDGVVYQEVPQPSARNSSNGPNLASQFHYTSGTILSSSGHIRVTVTPTHVTAEYVRAWLPEQETAQRRNGQVDDTWVVVKR